MWLVLIVVEHQDGCQNAYVDDYQLNNDPSEKTLVSHLDLVLLMQEVDQLVARLKADPYCVVAGPLRMMRKYLSRKTNRDVKQYGLPMGLLHNNTVAAHDITMGMSMEARAQLLTAEDKRSLFYMLLTTTHNAENALRLVLQTMGSAFFHCTEFLFDPYGKLWFAERIVRDRKKDVFTFILQLELLLPRVLDTIIEKGDTTFLSIVLDNWPHFTASIGNFEALFPDESSYYNTTYNHVVEETEPPLKKARVRTLDDFYRYLVGFRNQCLGGKSLETFLYT
jgi:hypothetical protein